MLHFTVIVIGRFGRPARLCSSAQLALSSGAMGAGHSQPLGVMRRFVCGQGLANGLKTTGVMRVSSDIAFKEWAVVVDTLGRGEQVLILRKGGIREARGEFHVEHASFWLFPTQYHEAERSIIPSKRAALRETAGAASKNFVDVEFFATADCVIKISDAGLLERLQGRHIWTEQTLKERFEFGRERGLHALVTRIYRRAQTERFAMRDEYGGCKSWVQLERAIAGDVVPVLSDGEFRAQREEIRALLSDHALAHS